MDYEEAVQYILKECGNLDLKDLNKEKVLKELNKIKPKEEAVG